MFCGKIDFVFRIICFVKILFLWNGLLFLASIPLLNKKLFFLIFSIVIPISKPQPPPYFFKRSLSWLQISKVSLQLILLKIDLVFLSFFKYSIAIAPWLAAVGNTDNGKIKGLNFLNEFKNFLVSFLSILFPKLYI